MIISFDRKRKEKTIGATSVSSRDVYQILDNIEEEMNRLYQEVYSQHVRQSRERGRNNKKWNVKKHFDNRQEEQIRNQVMEMDEIAKATDYMGMSLTEEKQIF